MVSRPGGGYDFVRRLVRPGGAVPAAAWGPDVSSFRKWEVDPCA
jgi:hypothetical protein